VLDVVTVDGGPQTMPCKTVRLPANPPVKMRGWNHVVLRQSPQGFHASINGSATNCTDGVYKTIDQVRIQVGSGDTANHWNYVDNVSFSIPQ
ncbi:MAG: hypothetical protein HY360_19280, partial [Verrucomicrobia bacterium]|nr:hypothetical protein [Verrucomicrobiota bacterium]